MDATKAAKQAVKDLRAMIGNTTDDEQAVLSIFIDIVGAELDSWKMRLEELEDEED